MRILVFWGFFLLAFSSRLLAANCGGAIPCQCGDTVKQNYVMTANLGPCQGHGLKLASGVTLDGQHYQIFGSGNSSTGYGVYLLNVTGATVKNVSVTKFSRGLRLRDASQNTISGVELFQNGNFSTHAGYGADVASGARNNIFRDSLIYENADEGIHFGSGSGGNVFHNNRVFDNYRENIYVLASDNNTFSDNETWGGTNSFYVKDAKFNTFRRNIIRDKTFLVRADSLDNLLADNIFLGVGLHFQVYTKDNPFRFPRTNEIIGGVFDGAATCLRFSSSWGNVIRDVLLKNCGAELLVDSDDAPIWPITNTAIGVPFSPHRVQLDNGSELLRGWRLNVRVQDVFGCPLAQAQVRALNVFNEEVFVATTDVSGDIPPQEVIALVSTGSQQTLYTPFTIETTKSGYQPQSQILPVMMDSSAVMTLTAESSPDPSPDPSPVNTPPIAEAGADRVVQTGELVPFDGLSSSDPDGDLLSYSWDFGDGSPMQTEAITNHVYKAPGVYTVTLTVDDGRATASDRAVITVYGASTSIEVEDDFNRSDSTHLGPVWTEVEGDWAIREQTLMNAPQKGQYITIAPSLFGATQRAAVDFTSTENNMLRRFGLIFRYQDPNNYYLLYRQAGASSTLRIAKIVEGHEAVLALLRIRNPRKGDPFRLEGRVEGTTLTVDLNNENHLSVTDDTFSAGSVGILLEAGRAVALAVDNFSGAVY